MTFADVVQKWPSVAALSRDIGRSPNVVKQWRRRASIPPEYWLDVERAARRRGIEGVTVFAMAEIAAASAVPAEVS